MAGRAYEPRPAHSNSIRILPQAGSRHSDPKTWVAFQGLLPVTRHVTVLPPSRSAAHAQPDTRDLPPRTSYAASDTHTSAQPRAHLLPVSLAPPTWRPGLHTTGTQHCVLCTRSAYLLRQSVAAFGLTSLCPIPHCSNHLSRRSSSVCAAAGWAPPLPRSRHPPHFLSHSI